jgi:hypothetical protein
VYQYTPKNKKVIGVFTSMAYAFIGMKKVSFQLNKKLDKEIILDFLSASEAGVDFGAGIISVHPQLKKVRAMSSGKRKETISKYVDTFYTKHNKELRSTLSAFEKEWSVVENAYFVAVEKMFGKKPIPRKGYRAFLSIVDCNPRFLETKSFQIYWKHHDGVRFVVAHEILHFFFFDYVKKHFPKLYKSPFLWDVSEIFNSVVLATQPFSSIHSVKKMIFYPHHRPMLTKASLMWKKNPDVKVYIPWLFEYFKNTQ